MQVTIGDRVRVKRGAYARSAIRRTALDRRAEGNAETGTVLQVWRGDSIALLKLDRDGCEVAFQLRDLRRPKVSVS